MISNKQAVQDFIEILVKKDIQDVVISPGSRNAALTLSLVHHPHFNTYSVPDERSAAFIALGMIQATGKPTAVLCTSGSAVLNYAPAVGEAFYQKLPLIVISADRPMEWIDQQDGQTIRQQGALSNHVVHEVQLLSDPSNSDQLWYNQRITNEALNAAMHENAPVHINFPFNEPLYETDETANSAVKVIEQLQTTPQLSQLAYETLAESWNHAEERVLLIGQMPKDPALEALIQKLADSQSITILSETTSNVSGKGIIPCIDRFIASNAGHLNADLLISIGDAVVSKRIKKHFRTQAPSYHWHVNTNTPAPDTYQALTHHIPLEPLQFLETLMKLVSLEPKKSAQYNQALNLQLEERSKAFILKAPFSDLSVFHFVKEHISHASHDIHIANSAPIRYAQLFHWERSHSYFCNRGTSGIDGSISTALGYSVKVNNKVFLITGDISFFYDSNAFFNPHLPSNLKVIILNNGGGNIFNIIPGPSQTETAKPYFDTPHQFNAEHIAAMHHIAYMKAENESDLENHWKGFYEHGGAAILEIVTNPETNPQVLNDFFKNMDMSNTNNNSIK